MSQIDLNQTKPNVNISKGHGLGDCSIFTQNSDSESSKNQSRSCPKEEYEDVSNSSIEKSGRTEKSEKSQSQRTNNRCGRNRGGGRRGDGNRRGQEKSKKHSVSSSGCADESESPCSSQFRNDNSKQVRDNHRGGGYNRRRDGQWTAHRENSVPANRPFRQNSSMMSMEHPFYYSPVLSNNNLSPRMHQNMPQHMSQNMPPQMSQNMPPQMSQNMPPHMSQNMPHCMQTNMRPHMQQNMPQHMSQHMQQNMPQRMQNNMPPHMQQNIPQNMPQRMQNNMPPHMQQNLPQNMPQRMQNNMPPHMQQNMPQRMQNNMRPHMQQNMHQRMQNNMPPHNKPQQAVHHPSHKEKKANFISSKDPTRKKESKSKVNPDSVNDKKQSPLPSRENAGKNYQKVTDSQTTSENDHAGITSIDQKEKENKKDSPPASPVIKSKQGLDSATTDTTAKIQPALKMEGMLGHDPLQGEECVSSNSELLQDEIGHELKINDDRERLSLQRTLSLTMQHEPKLATDTVPMNFGIELLDSAVHNNIDLLADGGAVIRANSVILSCNSPVLHRMTTSLELQEIDMKEFSEKSVRIFVEAAYTGKLPDIPSDIFRDLHKISHAFQVGWLSESCFAMFTEFSHQIDEIVPLYLEQVYLFEEAAYVLSKLKLVHFRDLAIVRIQSSESGKRVFIKKYLKGLTTLSACHLDMIVLLASSDIDMIVDPLKELLVQQLGVKGTAISDECKYLLNKCDLSPCRRYNSKLFEQLFDVLQDLAVDSSEDMKWVLELHRKSAKNSEEVEKVVMEEKTAKEGNEAKIPTKNKWFWQK